MATGTSPPPLPPGHRQVAAGYGDFVDEHLAKVRSGIRVSDFFAKAMGLAALVLIYLLGLIVIDHWVTDLGTVGRVLGLSGLILGSGYYVVRHLAGDLLRKINPAYAAQMIEQTEPSLRNSLINFVMLRPKRESVREVIYQQVEQQAASRLSRVDVGDAVDQTPLIRLALCLLGAMVLFAAYTIFSPKSPFQSIGRIISPFSEMSRPARVRIDDIQPRNATVFAGESVEVSALVDLDDDAEPVWLIYSTTDGQKVDVKRPMLRDPISLRHVARPTDDGLISQTIDYRIVAGDAEEGPFRITVSQAPTIFVEQIVLDYPEYTGLASEILDNQADVRALEGTRVTIQGRTNQDIDSARIELDPNKKNPTRLKMTSNGRVAEGSFLIKLRQDRRTPLNESYQLKFTSTDGKTSQDPVEHTIQVLPDLGPQVEILTPARRAIEVPQNAQQVIEVRGLDPDYGLPDLRIQAAHDGKKIIDHPLLSEPGLGQRVGKFVFRPREYGLQVGDDVIYIGLAKDNRADAETGSPMPNASVTERYTIRITAPREVPANEDSGLEQDDGGNDQPEPGDGDEGDQGEGAEGEGAEGEGADGNEGAGADGEEGETGEGAVGEEGLGQEGGGADGENGEEREGANEGEGAEGGGAKGEGGEGEGAEGEGAEGGEKGEGGDQKGDAADGNKAEGAGGEGNEPGQRQEGEGGENGGEGDPQAGAKEDGEGGAGEPQEGAPGGEAPEGGNDPTTNAKGAQQQQDGDPQGKQPGDGADPGDVDEAGEPVDADGSEDGEAFDRIVEHMKEKFGEASDGTPKPCPNGECADGGDGSGSNAGEQDGEKGEQDGEKSGGGKGVKGAGQDGEKGEGSEGGDDAEKGGKEGAEQGGAGKEPNGEKGGGEQPGAEGKKGGGEKPGAAAEKPGDKGKGGAEGEGGDKRGDKPGGEKGDKPGRDGEPGKEGAEPGDQGEGEGEEVGGEGEREGENGAGDQGKGNEGKGKQPGENGDPSEVGGDPSEVGGDQPGEGGENPGQNADGNPGGQPGKETSDGADGADANSSNGDGGPSNQNAQAPNSPQGDADWFDDKELPEPGGDDPNLEYARKATNLALDYLKHNEDEQLQKDLGWTDEQMRSFVKRWQQMQDGAATADPAESDRELNDALRSLGMRRGDDRIRKSGSKDDKIRVRDAGTRSQPPAEYIEQYRAYLKSLGKRPEK